MRPIHSHYENLKVARDAPIEVIHAAYETLAAKYRPRLKAGEPEATRIAMILSRSYVVLSDPEQRAEHDRWIARAEADPVRATPKAPELPSSLAWAIGITVAVVAAGVFISSEPAKRPQDTTKESASTQTVPDQPVPRAPIPQAVPAKKQPKPQIQVAVPRPAQEPPQSEIDEVIASGKFSKLPPAEVVRQSDGDGPAHLSVLNQTIYTITATFYSSIEQSVEINAGQSMELDLVPGAYRVLCRASDPTVWPFISNDDKYVAGTGYKWTLLIKHQITP